MNVYNVGFGMLRVRTSTQECYNLSTRKSNLEYRHRHLVKKVIQVSDAEVADGSGQIRVGWCLGGARSVDDDPKRQGDYRIEPAGAGVTSYYAAERFANSAAVDYGF
nr:hypothetical protein [Tanacetum cinerariifolium]